MTRCPVCRGNPIDCICENGLIPSEWMDSRPATRQESTFFWTVTIAALVPWALLLWKGLPI